MNSLSALVVDDSKSARFALRKYLEGLSIKVDTAESAEEAYSFLKSHRPDLIFLDHVMPGIDGFEALRHLKDDPHTGNIPVVICSSNEGEDFTNEARSKGAADVLQKPPSSDALQRVLDNLQQLSVSLRSPVKTQDHAQVPPATPAKVAAIREPDIAIEQAVMHKLRTSLPPREPAPPAFNPAATGSFAPPHAAPPAINPAATGSFNTSQTGASRESLSAQQHAMRDQIEQRLRKITHDLFVQVAELKAGMAHLESRQRAPEEEDALIERAVSSSVANLQDRLDTLERRIETRFEEMRAQLNAALHTQSERINQVAQQARTAAAEEARAASERTVMSAASRIADQLADAISKALGRR